LNSWLKVRWFLIARPFLLHHYTGTLPNLPNLKCPVSGVHSILTLTESIKR
jgi:hypothetical protein